MSLMNNEMVRKELYSMLAAVIITPIESFWIPPVAITATKEGSPRFCVSFSKFNSVMQADRWHLLRVHEILGNIKGSCLFTTIDIFQEYWQIKMGKVCKEKDPFICGYGTF